MVQVIQKISGGHWGQVFFVAHADGPTKKGAALDLSHEQGRTGRNIIGNGRLGHRW